MFRRSMRPLSISFSLRSRTRRSKAGERDCSHSISVLHSSTVPTSTVLSTTDWKLSEMPLPATSAISTITRMSVMPMPPVCRRTTTRSSTKITRYMRVPRRKSSSSECWGVKIACQSTFRRSISGDPLPSSGGRSPRSPMPGFRRGLGRAAAIGRQRAADVVAFLDAALGVAPDVALVAAWGRWSCAWLPSHPPCCRG